MSNDEALQSDAGASVEDFNARYRVVADPLLRRAERRVIGSDFGATSYTTKAQADDLAALLELSPESLLLDVGTGAGWPGVYLAQSTGARTVLADRPVEGLRNAAARVSADGTAASPVNASGEALPFKDETFDAITSSDVFC